MRENRLFLHQFGFFTNFSQPNRTWKSTIQLKSLIWSNLENEFSSSWNLWFCSQIFSVALQLSRGLYQCEGLPRSLVTQFAIIVVDDESCAISGLGSDIQIQPQGLKKYRSSMKVIYFVPPSACVKRLNRSELISSRSPIMITVFSSKGSPLERLINRTDPSWQPTASWKASFKNCFHLNLYR